MNTKKIVSSAIFSFFLFSFFLFSFFLILPSNCIAADVLDEKSLDEQLYLASVYQDVPKMKELIGKGANPNYREGGRSILGWAAQAGNSEVVQQLVDAKADVKSVDDGIGHTALMRAIETHKTEIVKILLKAKSDPNAKTPEGETVLEMAVSSRKPEIVQAVVDAGADVKYVQESGDSPALIAAQDGSPQGVEIIGILGKAKANLNSANAAYTPLFYAAEHGNKEMVKALLDAGADPNTKTPSGSTPLNAAIDKKEIVEILLAGKADPNQTGSYGTTILIAAIENGEIGAVEALIKGGADVNKRSDQGSSPLQVANNYSKSDVVELLKKHGAAE